MKSILFSKSRLFQAALFLGFLFQSNNSQAQSRIYAHDQVSNVYGVCLACGVQNPLNALGDNEDNYSTMVMGTVLLGGVEQTLRFPEVRINTKLVIGIGTNDIPLTVQLLSGVYIETLSGTTANNDSQMITGNLLKLADNPTRATIELIPASSYNAVKIRLSGGVLSLGGGFRIYYAYQDPLANILAYSKNGQITLGGNVPLEGSEVTLRNASGKEIHRSILKSKTFEMSSPQPEGIYILTIETKDKKVYSRKIRITN
ncbi:T9SS type A sorting domain-containing protein [Chryseobacterium sp. MIQD13]|uniref:T9SS type A sorting domain-containing protein n=1 Tax=Chryseobacterium sp. MIQD13 TaxID=3422310 RepID=UPI003D265F99